MQIIIFFHVVYVNILWLKEGENFALPPCKVLPFSQFSIFRITYLFAKTFPSI
jgi:hypothetical protein